MDSSQSTERHSSKKNVFAKLHTRVQNRFERMRRKLKTAKSTDSVFLEKDNSLVAFNKKNDYSTKNRLQEETIEVVGRMFTRRLTLQEVNTKSIFFKDVRINSNDEYQFVPVSSENHASDNEKITEFAHTRAKPRKESKDASANMKKYGTKPNSDQKSLNHRSSANRDKTENAKMMKMEKQHGETLTDNIKVATVVVAVVDTKGLRNISDSSLNCQLRLGSEYIKLKAFNQWTSTVEWLNLNMYKNDFSFEMGLWDDDFLLEGNIIDLCELENEKTHKFFIKLKDKPDVELDIFVTITRTKLHSAALPSNFRRDIQNETVNITEENMEAFQRVINPKDIKYLGAKPKFDSDDVAHNFMPPANYTLSVNQVAFLKHVSYEFIVFCLILISKFEIKELTEVTTFKVKLFLPENLSNVKI